MTGIAASELAATALFRDLPAERLEALAACARRERHEVGRLLLRQGEAARTLHLLRSGSVSLELAVPGREPLVVETLGPGDLVGASWLLPPARVHFDVRVREPLESIRLETACLERLMAADTALGHRLCRRLLAVVVRRLQATRVRLMDLYGHPEPFGGGPEAGG